MTSENKTRYKDFILAATARNRRDIMQTLLIMAQETPQWKQDFIDFILSPISGTDKIELHRMLFESALESVPDGLPTMPQLQYIDMIEGEPPF